MAVGSDQTNPDPNSYDGPVDYSITEFTSDPVGCKIDYACKTVVPSDLDCSDLNLDGMYDGDDSDGKITFTPTQEDYENQKYPPGDYTVTICGKVRQNPTASEDCKDITITFVDPCDPPSSLMIPD